MDALLFRDFTSSTFAKYPDIHREYLQSHQPYKIVFWTLFGIYTVYTGVTFSLYLYYALRHHDKALKERSVYLASLQTFFGYVFGINAIFHSAILDYPCYVDIWLIYGAYVPWMTTLALSMARYYTRKRTNSIFVNKTQETPIDPAELDSYLAKLAHLSTERATDFAEEMYCQQRRPHSIDISIRASEQSSAHIREVAPFLDVSPPSEEHTQQSHKGQHSASSDEHEQLPMQDLRVVVWQRRLSSPVFITWMIGTSFAVQFVIMVFFTIFSRKMSLKEHHYNCIRGWIFIPIMVVSGLFNALAYPVYIVVIWSFQDGYGIRTTLIVGSALSVGFWAAAITWRLVKHDADIFISGSLFYLAEIIYVYTCTVVVPLVISIRFASRSKGSTAEMTATESRWIWSTAIRHRHYGNSKQAFLEGMQDGAKYKQIKQHAQACFCEELILFLNVYVSLKNAVVNVMLNQTSQSADALQSLPAVSNSSPSYMRPKKLRSALTAPCFIKRHLGKSPTSSMAAEGRFVDRDSANPPEPHSYSLGMVETLQHAFPHNGIDETTALPEELRDTVSTVIRTFVLPDSILAINANNAVVATCKSFLSGSQLPLATLDMAKDEVLDLLYSNVYLRLPNLQTRF